MQHSRNDELKIKRFGQVFSGKLVGDLLVELLPSGFVGKTIIDPMVGQGDLLKAAHENYLSADLVLGIDIDEDVISKCTEIFREQRYSRLMHLIAQKLIW